MLKSAIYLLPVSLGLVMVLYLSIIYTWFYQYFEDLTSKKVRKHISGILSELLKSSDDKVQKNIERLSIYVGKRSGRIEALINIILSYGDDFIKIRCGLLMEVYTRTGITSYLIKGLSLKNRFKKSMSCRRLGELYIKGTELHLRSVMSTDSNDITYNVLLALAKLGDVEGLVYIFTNHSERINISYRAVIEVFTSFNGPKEEFLKSVIDLCDDYIRSILIKASADYKLDGMKEHYLKYLKSSNKNLRIACIIAVSSLSNPDLENYISDMLSDSEWEVRAIAAKSLERFGTSKSFTILEKAVADSEWWVRHNAANTLISIPGGREYISKIINGEDKFARDAVMHSIQLTCKIGLQS